MFNPYDRRKVSEVLFTKANLIHPSFSFGRQNQQKDDEFTLSFFLSCTKDELDLLNSLVDDRDEVLVHFYIQDKKGKCPRELKKDERKISIFSFPWEAKMLCSSWDELRGVSQEIIGIVFKP